MTRPPTPSANARFAPLLLLGAAIVAVSATMAGTTITVGSLNTLDVEVYQPAEVTLPARIHHVALDLRYDPQKTAKALKVAEAIWTQESSGQDLVGATAALGGLREALETGDRFTLVPSVELRQATGGSSDALEPGEVREVCEAHGLDGLITIDGFDSDMRDVTVATPAPEVDPFDEGDPFDETERNREPQVTTVKQMSVRVLIRVYDGESGDVIDEAVRTASSTVEKDRKTIVRDLGDRAARSYFERLQPWKQSVPRLLFMKGSDGIKRGYKLAVKRDWEAAEREWRLDLEDPKAKIRGRAAHNLALAHEMSGDLPGALEWVERAATEINATTVKQYRKVLQQRLPEHERVVSQWKEWKAGVARGEDAIATRGRNQ